MPHKTVIGRNLFDGGIRSHIGAATWLKQNVKQINECYSIYSRPRDLEYINWSFPEIKPFKKVLLITGILYTLLLGPLLSSVPFETGWMTNTALIYLNMAIGAGLIVSGMQINITKLLNRVVEVMNLEISKSDEKESDVICAKHMKRNEKIFAPYKLLKNAYANSKEDNLKMWSLGVEAVEENPNLWKVI